MDFFDILTMLGGLCLFLFGMNVMGESLERRAGNSLRALKADNADYKVRYQDYSRKYRLN